MNAFNNPYRVPGDDREYNLPRDYADLDKAWAAYYEARGEQAAEPVAIPEQRKPTGANTPDPIRSAREDEAIAWIKDYTGTFGLILDLRAHKAWGTKWFRLSDRQIEAVLDSKARDLARAKERTQTGRDLTVLPEGRTLAAVENDAGVITFMIFDRPGEKDRYGRPNRWAGWVFVKQFIGGVGEGQRLGSQRPGESYSGQWANLIDRVLADPEAAVRLFGQTLGICGVCQLPLTNEESREYGIGPVCRSKMGGA